MILDTNILKDIDMGAQYVVGKANKSTKILQANELVAMFDGVTTALDYIEKKYPRPISGNSSLSGGGHRGNSFDSYEHAMNVFRKHPEQVVKYDPTEMRPVEFEEQGNDLEYDVTGDFIDIGRVLEGVPENFGSLHNGNPRSRRVKLVVSLAQAHFMTPDEIDHRSERVIRLIDALESANIRTELTCIATARTSHVEVVVKRFDEPLTVEDVAVATHSEFFRRMIFRVCECSDTQNEYSYGDSTVLDENIGVLESELNDELSVYVGGNMRRKKNIDERFDKLEKMIEAELSEMIPTKSLMFVTDSGTGMRNLQNA